MVVGGRNNKSPALAGVELLEWNVQRRWWPLPSLLTPRCGCAIVSLPTVVQTRSETPEAASNAGARTRSQLFVLGGVNDASQPLATMESYVHRGGSETGWEEVPGLMSVSRMYPSAVSFVDRTPGSEAEEGKILVMGGRDKTWQELDSCELFSTTAGEWKSVSAMSKPRFGSAAVYLKQSHSVPSHLPSQ